MNATKPITIRYARSGLRIMPYGRVFGWYAYGYQTASLVLLFIALLEGISAVWRIVSFVIRNYGGGAKQRQ